MERKRPRKRNYCTKQARTCANTTNGGKNQDKQLTSRCLSPGEPFFSAFRAKQRRSGVVHVNFRAQTRAQRRLPLLLPVAQSEGKKPRLWTERSECVRMRACPGSHPQQMRIQLVLVPLSRCKTQASHNISRTKQVSTCATKCKAMTGGKVSQGTCAPEVAVKWSENTQLLQKTEKHCLLFLVLSASISRNLSEFEEW